MLFLFHVLLRPSSGQVLRDSLRELVESWTHVCGGMVGVVVCQPRRIPAKNAATRHLNAMGIAPKVVGASFLQPLTLMFRTNAPHTASQIPWVMQYAEQFTLIQELTPGASISASERGFQREEAEAETHSHSVLPLPPLHHRMFPLVPPANFVSRRPPIVHSTLFSVATNPVNDSYQSKPPKMAGRRESRS